MGIRSTTRVGDARKWEMRETTGNPDNLKRCRVMLGHAYLGDVFLTVSLVREKSHQKFMKHMHKQREKTNFIV